MRHNYFGKKLSRTKNERRRLFQMMAKELVNHGQIKTTITKAKAVQPLVEKIVTKAKKGGDISERALYAILGDRKLAELLVSEAPTRFGKRTSGFTRILRLGNRGGDNTQEVLFSFVDERIQTDVIPPKKEVAPSVEKKKTEKPAVTKSKKKVVAKKK